MTEKSAFDELLQENTTPVTEQVFEAKKEDISLAPTEVVAEAVVETPKVESQPVQAVEEVKTEKGWFGRSKDAIARGSENFLKKIGAGALESFDRNVTSRLSAGPKRQIERHQAEISKNEARSAALAELIKNTPDSSSNEKAKIQLQKNEDKLNSNKAKLEASNEKLNTRNKWQESVLNTRNEFLKNVAANYATVEASQKEKLTPLQAEKANCEAARQNLVKLHETRDADIAKSNANAETFKAAMMKGGTSEADVLSDPAYKEVLKQIEIQKNLKIEEAENLKKSEDKVNKRLAAQMDKFNKISKKRKDCEDSYAPKDSKNSEATTEDESRFAPPTQDENRFAPPTPNETTVASSESAPTFAVKEQIDLWNKLAENEPTLALNTVEFAARLFKPEDQKLTKDEFSKLATSLLLSQGANPSLVNSVSNLLKITA